MCKFNHIKLHWKYISIRKFVRRWYRCLRISLTNILISKLDNSYNEINVHFSFLLLWNRYVCILINFLLNRPHNGYLMPSSCQKISFRREIEYTLCSSFSISTSNVRRKWLTLGAIILLLLNVIDIVLTRSSMDYIQPPSLTAVDRTSGKRIAMGLSFSLLQWFIHQSHLISLTLFQKSW